MITSPLEKDYDDISSLDKCFAAAPQFFALALAFVYQSATGESQQIIFSHVPTAMNISMSNTGKDRRS